MPIVPAGNETGLYYIPVAGLPWQCSWQKLKDFARNKQPHGSWIEVEHAMVYPDQTNGWVSVRGREDFLNVLAHLNGGELEHRSLIADGRNETEPVYLCDLGSGKSSSTQRSRNDSIVTIATDTSFSSSGAPMWIQTPSMQPHAPQESFSEWNAPQSNYSPISAVFSNGTYYQPRSSVYEAPPGAYPVSQGMEYFAPIAQASIMYAGNMAPSTPVYIPQHQPVYPCFPLAFNTGLMSPPSTVRGIPQSPPNNIVKGPVVQTEARKVVIKGLPRDTSESALTTLIDQLCSKSSSRTSFHPTIHSVELARHADGKLKGHAFVVFESHRIAKKVLSAVDGHKYQSRELRATLAKEGVEPQQSTFQQGYPSPDSPSTMYAVDERQIQLQPAAPIKSSSKEYRDAQWVGNGSEKTSSSKGKEKTKDGSSGRERGRSRPKDRESSRGTPVVVNGSGRRRH